MRWGEVQDALRDAWGCAGKPLPGGLLRAGSTCPGITGQVLGTRYDGDCVCCDDKTVCRGLAWTAKIMIINPSLPNHCHFTTVE
jgi:hypothetical protein